MRRHTPLINIVGDIGNSGIHAGLLVRHHHVYIGGSASGGLPRHHQWRHTLVVADVEVMSWHMSVVYRAEREEA